MQLEKPSLLQPIQVPITLKPLPVLLAPSVPIIDSSFNLCYSSSSSLPSPPHSDAPHSDTNKTQHKHLLEHPSSSSDAYYLLVQSQSKEIQELRRDLIKLNQKYIHQIERIQTAEQARHQVEAELEDLSLRLFEQANKMVSEEKKKRFEAEKKTARLEGTLASVVEELNYEQAQLKELRERFEESQRLQHSKQGEGNPIISSSIMNKKLLPDHLGSFCIDDRYLTLFKDFLAVAPTTSIDSIHRLAFMKQCLDLDVEPCLRFGNAKLGHKLTFRKVLDAITLQPCFIESESKPYHGMNSTEEYTAPKQQHQKAPLNRRSSLTFPFGSRRILQQSEENVQFCYGCGTQIKQNTLFRCRLREQDNEWFTIDRACRDRLVAVCNFYVFIRHIQAGLRSQKTIHQLFKECIYLRLCMFWARSGVYDLT